ncbi:MULTISPECIES: hypothetical protein [unclassified Microcoleus]|nr:MULTISPECIES: hypothetical protein [unclassified Microcoleus]
MTFIFLAAQASTIELPFNFAWFYTVSSRSSKWKMTLRLNNWDG